ncbi:MAG: RNA methyltransferase [Lentisphaerae bacterium]|nr:RNA methyltransferase [Lentisphaerota bacterium]
MLTELSRREAALLRALTTRSGRKKSGCCRCEGLRAVRELLLCHPEKVLFVAVANKAENVLQCAPELLRSVPERLFNELSGTVTSQGVIAVAEIPPEKSGPVEGDFVLALDQLGDPGNFGTIARSLRAAGQKELWYTKGSIDPWGDKAIRSGMGVQFSLNMRRFDTLAGLAEAGKQHGIKKVFIADPHKGENCFTCRDLFDHSIIVIGGEPNGVMGAYPGAERVIIPMPGDYESINAAQAATVLIFESVRRKLN